MKFLFDGPLNTLSFGNVSFNILRELYRGGYEVGLFLCNDDISAFPIEESFKEWIQHGINIRWSLVNKEVPVLKLWHINGSERAISNNQTLLTFYECSEPTPIEVAICNRQKNTVFSSSYSADLFKAAGCHNTSHVHVGFDENFCLTGKKYLSDDVIHFGLMGKYENRKHTGKIIKTWLKKYGNNNKYLLSCCVTNPFFKAEDMQNLLYSCLEGKSYSNINFLPYLPSNMEVNEFMNSVDIDLTGLSGGEGWNLPSFNMTCLGKWSVVLNATAHKDWANAQNSILVEPNGTMDCYDGAFFNKNSAFNRGVFYNWSEEEAVAAMEEACLHAKTINTQGQNLAKEMSYARMVEKLLNDL